MTLTVKNLPAMQETQEIVSLIPGMGRSLEEEVATHSSIFAGRIPWTEKPGGLQSMGLQSQTRLSMHAHKPNQVLISLSPLKGVETGSYR